jgi:hypothetical protein
LSHGLVIPRNGRNYQIKKQQHMIFLELHMHSFILLLFLDILKCGVRDINEM